MPQTWPHTPSTLGLHESNLTQQVFLTILIMIHAGEFEYSVAGTFVIRIGKI